VAITTIANLVPDKANRRRHTPRNIGMIVNALHEVGAARSIVIDEMGNVLAGNATVEAAAEAGIERVQVVDADGETIIAVRRTGLSEEDKRRLALYDNRSSELAEWDTAQIAADLEAGLSFDGLFTAEELTDLMQDALRESVDVPDAHMDQAEQLREKWHTERGQIWEIPSVTVKHNYHRLMCGDSTSAEDVAALMGDAMAHMVWTDPPYGVAVGDKNKMLNAIAPRNRVEENLTGDTLDEPGIMKMLSGAFDRAIEHCLAGAAWYVAAPARPLHVLFGQALKDRGIWRQTIQWVKNNSTFSPMGVDYHWQAEPIFYGWLPNAGHRYYGGRKQTTVWEIDRPTKSPEHPTMKPVELVARAIENSSLLGELVYDPFLGSGTTMVAAEQLGRVCYGIEIEPRYTAVCLERMANMGLTPTLIESGAKP